ncbi:MAG: hypothetical protein R2568_07285 [Candidatus Scalindua sp.]|jgi:hypothetical protein|nr:hypothetical protein [Candidatus Scalindua sp.]MDV5166536.1 hypothetical protein [Candidatus Scalindua sp.]
MKRYIVLILISSLLLSSLTFGDSSQNSRKTHKNSNIVGVTIDDRDASVEIREKLDKKGNVIKKSFNHPFHFTEAGLADLLSSVYYKAGENSKDREGKMVFWKDELKYIISPIISAFSMANASQDILVFSSPHHDVLGHTRNYFSIFMTGNELNIVFSTIKCKKSWLTDGRAIQMKTYSRDNNKYIFKDPLEVERGFRWSVVPMEGQRLAEERRNWLIIDLTYFGDSNLFGRAGSDDSNNISEDSMETGSGEVDVEGEEER